MGEFKDKDIHQEQWVVPQTLREPNSLATVFVLRRNFSPQRAY